MSHCKPQLSVRVHSSKGAASSTLPGTPQDFNERASFTLGDVTQEENHFSFQRLRRECFLNNEAGEEMYRFQCDEVPQDIWRRKDAFWIQKTDEIFLEVTRYHPASTDLFRSFQTVLNPEEDKDNRVDAIQDLVEAREYPAVLCGVETLLGEEESSSLSESQISYLAELLFKLGDPAGAVAFLSRQITNPDTSTPQWLHFLKTLLSLEGTHDEGRTLALKRGEEISKDVRLQPWQKFSEMIDLAEILEEEGNIGSAMEVTKMLARNSEPAVRTQAAIRLEERGFLEEALDIYRKLITAPDRNDFLGESFYALDRFESLLAEQPSLTANVTPIDSETKKALLRAAAQDKKTSRWNHRLEAALQLWQRPEEAPTAQEALKSALQDSDYSFSLKTEWAKKFCLAGEKELSEPFLAKALDPEQSYVSAKEREELSEELLTAGKVSLVIPFLDTEIKPHQREESLLSPAVAIRLADGLNERNFKQEAMNVYRWIAAQRSSVANSSLRMRAAEALEKGGDKTSAVQAYKDIGLDRSSLAYDQEACLKILQKRTPKETDVLQIIAFNITQNKEAPAGQKLSLAKKLLEAGYKEKEDILWVLSSIARDEKGEENDRLLAAKLHLQYASQPDETMSALQKGLEEKRAERETQKNQLRAELQDQRRRVEERFEAAKTLWDLGDEQVAANAVRGLFREPSSSETTLDMVRWAAQKWDTRQLAAKEIDAVLQRVLDQKDEDSLEAAQFLRGRGKKEQAQAGFIAIAFDPGTKQNSWVRMRAADEIEEEKLKTEAYLRIARTATDPHSSAERLLKMGEKTFATSALSYSSGGAGLEAAKELLRLGEVTLAVEKAFQTAKEATPKNWEREGAIDFLVEVGATSKAITAYEKLISDTSGKEGSVPWKQRKWTEELTKLDRNAAIRLHEKLLSESNPSSPQYAESAIWLRQLYRL